MPDVNFTILKKNTAGDPEQEKFVKEQLLTIGKFKISTESAITFSEEGAKKWYAHKEQEVSPEIFQEIIDNMMTPDLLLISLKREDELPAWKVLRVIMGATNPDKAGAIPDEWCEKLGLPLGTLTIRAQGKKYFNWDIGLNGMHGSDSLESLQRETEILLEEIG